MLLDVIKYTSNLSHLLPIWCGRKHKSLLWWYAMTGLVFDLSSFVLRILEIRVPGQANLFLVIECCFISMYYKKRVFANPKWFRWYVAVLLLFFMVHTLFLRHYDPAKPFDQYRMNLEGGALFCLHYIVYAIIGLYRMIQKPDIGYLGKSELFWSNIAFLIYASGVFFIFLSQDIILTYDKTVMILLWGYIFCSFNIVKNVLIAKSLSLEHGRIKT